MLGKIVRNFLVNFILVGGITFLVLTFFKISDLITIFSTTFPIGWWVVLAICFSILMGLIAELLLFREKLRMSDKLFERHTQKPQRRSNFHYIKIAFYINLPIVLLIIIMSDKFNWTANQETIWISLVTGLIVSTISSAQTITAEIAKRQEEDDEEENNPEKNPRRNPPKKINPN